MLGQQHQRVALLVRERPLAPVVDRQRTVDVALRRQRRGGHGLEALALHLPPAPGIEPDVRVREDVRRRHRARFPHRADDRSAPGRDRPAGGVLVAVSPRGAQDVAGRRVPVPAHDEGRLRPHHLEGPVHDRVQDVVEIERGRQRAADRLDGVEEDGAPVRLRHVGDERRRAADASLPVAQRNAARREEAPGGPLATRHLVDARGLALERAAEPARKVERSQRRRDPVHGTTDRAGPLDRRQRLHRGVPAGDEEIGGDHDQRGFQTVQDGVGDRLRVRDFGRHAGGVYNTRSQTLQAVPLAPALLTRGGTLEGREHEPGRNPSAPHRGCLGYP